MIIWKDDHTTIFRSALYETVSTVIETKNTVIIVDPCWLPHEIEEIKQYVDSVKGNRPLYLLFTHSDFDHILGYGAFPEAKVIASSSFANKSQQEKEEVIEEIKTFDDEYYITRNYDILYPNVDFPIREDKAELSISGTKLLFYQAPGHNEDGLFTFIKPLGVLVVGDYLSDIEFPFITYNSYDYEKSLEKIELLFQRQKVRLLITGHGNPTANLEEMKKRLGDAQRYINQLRKYIQEGNDKGLQQLIADYKFPRNMRKSHKANEILIMNELMKQKC